MEASSRPQSTNIRLALHATKAKHTGFVWALLILLLAVSSQLSCGPQLPGPFSGAPEFAAPSIVALPLGTSVNMLGGNFMVRRTDLVLRTQVIPFPITRVYNSTTISWQWGILGITLAAQSNGTFVFTDPTGTVWPAQAAGPIPGSDYVIVNGTFVVTKQGLVFGFLSNGTLGAIAWRNQTYPQLTFSPTQIQQCTSSSSCTTIATITQGSYGPTAISDSNGRQVIYAYNGNLLSNAKTPKEVANNWTGEAYGYDSQSRLSQVTTSENVQIQMDYNPSRSLSDLKQIGSGGNLTWSVTYAAGSASNTSNLTSPLGNVKSFVWDSSYNLNAITDATGLVRSFAWSGRRISKVTAPDGTSASATYTDDAPATVTDAAGNTVTYSYNETGVDPGAKAYPITSASDPQGTLLYQTFDSSGRLATSTNGAGNQTSYAWSFVGEPSTATSPASVVTTFGAYDTHGNSASVARGNAKVTAVYDAVGRITRSYQPTDSFPTGGQGIQLRGFDENDNVVKLTTSTSVSGTSPADAITLALDSRGNVNAITRPYGGNASMSYDAYGRLISRCETVSGASQCTFFNRDADSRLTYTLLPNGMKTSLQYDAAGRVTQVQTSLSGTVQQTKTMSYTNGKLTSQSDSSYSAAETFAYDSVGRLSMHTFPSGESISYTYTVRSLVATETFFNPDGSTLRTLSYKYDGANRLLETDDGSNLLTSKTYVKGRVDHTAWGNGLVRTMSYDSGGFYNGSTTKNGSTTVLQDTIATVNEAFFGNAAADFAAFAVRTSGGYSDARAYQLYVSAGDGNVNIGNWSDGALAGVSDAADLNCTPLGCTSANQNNFTYDALGGITNRVYQDPNGVTLQDWDWQWNAEHNRLQKIVTGTYDPHPGQIVHSYSWDAAGFVTNRDGQAISFSAAGRVVQVGTASASWDLDGRAVSIQIPGYSKSFRYGGLVEMAGSTPDVLLVGGVRVHLGSTARRYLHLDFRGNVDAVFDESGNLVAHTTYDGFGSRASSGDTENVQHFAQGLEFGTLELMGMRLYDEDAGMFLQPDPVYDVLSQYTYARNNPVLLWDPAGIDPAALIDTDAEADAALASAERSGKNFGAAQAAGVGAAFAPLFGLLGEGAIEIGGLIGAVGSATIMEDEMKLYGDEAWLDTWFNRLSLKQQLRLLPEARRRIQEHNQLLMQNEGGGGGGAGVQGFAGPGSVSGLLDGPSTALMASEWAFVWSTHFPNSEFSLGWGSAMTGPGGGGGDCGLLGPEAILVIMATRLATRLWRRRS